MSDSQDERELSANMFPQDCVSAASSYMSPVVIGLGLDCYSSDTKEMWRYGYEDRANAIHKQVWDAGVPCFGQDGGLLAVTNSLTNSLTNSDFF